MKSLGAVLKLSEDFLAKKGVSNFRRNAEDIFSLVLGLSRLELYLKFDYPLNEIELAESRALLARRAKGEPFAYLAKEVSFFDSSFNVNPSVLIPRQETEILASSISKKISPGKILLDLCCGSGCLGISLKKKIPDLQVLLSDISIEALEVAKVNALKNLVDVEFFQGDLLTPLKGRKVDYVVCNPPYISEEEWTQLEADVKEFEPKIALTASNNGLEYYYRLSKELPEYLYPQGKVFFEIGYSQGDVVKKIFSTHPWSKGSIQKDWSGKDRFFFVEIE
jgi:release factor glutamine methyltransferase